MRYGPTDPGGQWLAVWNSRDGVTPFGMRHPRTGEDLTHLPPWSADIFDPLHVPNVGEHVWIDLDPEKAMQLAMRNVEHWWDDGQYPARERFESKLEMAQMLVEDYLFVIHPDTGERIEKHAPDLVQVTEPLRDRLAAEMLDRLRTVDEVVKPDWSRTIHGRRRALRMNDETMVDLGGGMVVPLSEVTCCHGVDDVCVSSGCILGIPGGERSDDLCDVEGCSCHDQ